MAKKKEKRSQRVGTPALRVLEEHGIDFELFEYEHSRVMEQGYALDTVRVLGVDPQAVFKTLMVEADGAPAVAVVQADRLLNLKLFARALGVKHAQMMDPAKAERITGYVTGGISPLGQRTLVPTVIDADAESRDNLVISGGKRTLSILLSPVDLATLTNAIFAPVGERRH